MMSNELTASPRVRRALLWAAPFFVLGAGACKPNLGSPPSIVEGPRLLAVRGLPPEAAESAPVTYDVLAVDVDGRIASPIVAWAQCDQRKPPAESNAVAAACLDVPAEKAGPTYTAELLPDACKLFGPQPDVDANMVPIRPRDPDVTGGFYEPVRAVLQKDGATAIAFALERITCRLTNAPQDIAGQYAELIKPNQNPTLARLTLDPDGGPVPLYARAPRAAAPPPPAAATTWVSARSTYSFELAWTDDTPEAFPVWNRATQTLDMHREALSVSWYATDGAFEHDRTGRGETEEDPTTRNTWTAPATPGLVHLWIVLRDSRGGIDFAEALVEVRP
jgi:hypothetical protein